MHALKRMLILEDDNCSAELLRQRILHEWPDCTFVHVANKTDYLNAIASDSFDLILSDYSIPGYSGMQALAVARKEYPEVPFLFFSGAISDEVAVESLKGGAVDYILKDRPARLVPAIKRALDLAEFNSRRVEHEKLVNSMDGIVWQAELPSLKFTFVSQQAERILGYPIERWIREPDFWQKHIYPDDQEMAVKLCRNATPEQNHLDFEYRMIAADGRTVWLRDMVNVRVRRNKSAGIQGIMVDVTRNKLDEQKIKDVQLKLEQTNQDLLRRNQEVQNFYHVLSHELKTPLTAAREFVSLVMDGLAGPLNKTQAEYLGIARESCNQLRVCINDLLDTTRIETGKLSLEFASVDLAELGRRVVRTMQSKASERNVHLGLELAPDLPLITADESRVTQVITNLIDNAFKFTPSEGQVSVKIQGVPGRDDYVQVSVNDTGRGIPKGEEDCIFDRLYQIKTGDATSGNGIGLGLYLCRELVWLHGGVIWAKSEPGEGSVFTFMLPREQKRTKADVLLIDDDHKILDTVSAMLETEYHVRTAADGEEGIKEMRRKAPHIVIMDLSMPNVDGVEVLKAIRDNWSFIPVIVHTAYSEGDIMKRAMEYSPFTLLSKPSGMDSLLRAVRCLSLGVQKEYDGETRILEKSQVFTPHLPAFEPDDEKSEVVEEVRFS
ncbi:MAG TPA: response regulator [Verrucomicrobiae bacterium]|jgi:PAS domain S-box-containing protein|nr:response regulator [Verrucomicrobiae bacterium]